MPDALAPDRVLPLLRGRFGRPYVYSIRCATTQRLLEAEAPEGAVAVCEEQTAGRGRLGRRWEAPLGTAILCSLLLRPDDALARPQLSLVAGLAVAEAIEQSTRRRSGIKWPNDVLLEGRKVAGILAETRGEAVVVGLGVNVSQRLEDLPPRRCPAATSMLVATGVEHDRAPVLAALLERLERRYEEWQGGGLAALHADLAARDELRGRRVRVDDLEGVAAGMDADGGLVLETAAGRRVLVAGEVTLPPD